MFKFKKPTKAQVKEVAGKAVQSVTGPTHFVLKSAADITVAVEAKAVHKLTGMAKTAIIEDRHNKTEETQEKIKSFCTMSRKEFEERLSDLYDYGATDTDTV